MATVEYAGMKTAEKIIDEDKFDKASLVTGCIDKSLGCIKSITSQIY